MARWLLIVVCGCGRVAFDTSVDQGTASNYVGAVMVDMPVAYWRFSERSGSVAIDAIGGKHGAIIGGVTHVQGATNDGDLALAFDGMSGRVEIGDYLGFPGTTSYSIELWARRGVVDDKVRWLIDRTSNTDPEAGWQLYTGRDFTLHSRSTGSQETGYSGTSELESSWQHLVATFDGTEARFYRDGEMGTNMFSTDPLPDVPGLLVFGDLARGQFYKFDGALDDIAIYDRALSQAQVRDHFRASGR